MPVNVSIYTIKNKHWRREAEDFIGTYTCPHAIAERLVATGRQRLEIST